jgi:C_GCAxxG_C_C family probable redox protein
VRGVTVVDREAAIKMARERFDDGMNCAQAVSSVINDTYGLNVEAIPRMMAPFGGGVSRCDELCGAVTGAVAAIGMVFGRDGEEAAESKELCYELTRRFVKEFRRLRGATHCTDLLGINLSDAAQLQRAQDEEYFRKECPGIVGDSVRLVVEVIESALAEG